MNGVVNDQDLSSKLILSLLSYHSWLRVNNLIDGEVGYIKNTHFLLKTNKSSSDAGTNLKSPEPINLSIE